LSTSKRSGTVRVAWSTTPPIATTWAEALDFEPCAAGLQKLADVGFRNAYFQPQPIEIHQVKEILGIGDELSGGCFDRRNGPGDWRRHRGSIRRPVSTGLLNGLVLVEAALGRPQLRLGLSFLVACFQNAAFRYGTIGKKPFEPLVFESCLLEIEACTLDGQLE
jgi:hypothetical protein